MILLLKIVSLLFGFADLAIFFYKLYFIFKVKTVYARDLLMLK
jgi:hypothetical protein